MDHAGLLRVSGYLLQSGVIEVTQGVVQATKDKEGIGFWVIGLVFGAILALLSLGLLLRIEFARKIVTWVCGINLLFGVLDLFTSFAWMLAIGFFGVLIMLATLLRICADGLMIYLIGETDKMPQI